MRFEDALAIVLHWEGGYSDSPTDPGGATNFGITHHTLKRWRGVLEVTKLDVENLTQEEAGQIYRELYWNACRCAELPSGVDLMVFDSAVNQGPTRAVTFLQLAVGATRDGILGPKTIAAAKSADPGRALDEIAARRAVHYAGLQREFWLGWYRRLIDVHGHALTYLE